MNVTESRFFARGALSVLVLAGVFSCQLFVSNTHAALIVIGAPPSVVPGALESNTDTYAFYESTKVLGAALSVDIITPGFYSVADPDDPGAIAAKTPVNSYMIHHDSIGTTLNTQTITVIAPNTVLGIIIYDANLDASDPILGNNPGTLYPTGLAFRGLEVPGPVPLLTDWINWSGNMITITLKTTTAEVLDQIRVITAVPEPSTFALAALAAPIAWMFRKRLRRR